MKKRIISGLSIWIFMVVILSSSTAILETEEFTARVLSGGMQYTESVKKIKITIDSYLTDEEVLNLIGLMSQQGYQAFMDAFRALNKGIFFPIGGRGIKIIIHGAHSIPTEKGRQILLFTSRQSWDVEMNPRTDSRFGFMVVELNVDNKGKGTGKIYEQASIQLTPQRTIVMDGYNSPPKQLWDVRLSK
ncbi:MAG: hypothetical protein A2V45_11990 [Candidatus Aminicenantes bacterium RBG_19FT_COMBO_58_17]|jgi:hypothetical protein|nr:MAG: hypothetical protein A2V45_11990 [Candidatus Aminicenantes bacterium RBG_19FT_COMBO_58_17]